MIPIYIREGVPSVSLKLAVTRGQTREKEDFSRASVWVWLYNRTDKVPVSVVLQEDGTLMGVVPGDLCEGVWGVKVIWTKDIAPRGHRHPRPEWDARTPHGRAERYSFADMREVLAIVDREELSSVKGRSEATVSVTLSAASYGADGLSSYELAVMHDMTTLCERDWVANLSELNEKLAGLSIDSSGAIVKAEEAAREAKRSADEAKRSAEVALGAAGDCERVRVAISRLYEVEIKGALKRAESAADDAKMYAERAETAARTLMEFVAEHSSKVLTKEEYEALDVKKEGVTYYIKEDGKIVGGYVNGIPFSFAELGGGGGEDEPGPAVKAVIRYGGAATWEDVDEQQEYEDGATIDLRVTVREAGQKMYFLVPAKMSVTNVMMGPFAIPMEDPYVVTWNGEEWKVYESSNTYDAGTFPVVVNGNAELGGGSGEGGNEDGDEGGDDGGGETPENPDEPENPGGDENPGGGSEGGESPEPEQPEPEQPEPEPQKVVYFGGAPTWQEVDEHADFTEGVTTNLSVTVRGAEQKIYFLVPAAMSIASIMMGPFEIPMEQPVTVSRNGVEWKLYESSNTYDAGTFPVVIK